MEINTQIHHSEMVSDMDNATGEMSLNTNIYIEARGASPAERDALRVILNNFYKDIRAAAAAVGR